MIADTSLQIFMVGSKSEMTDCVKEVMVVLYVLIHSFCIIIEAVFAYECCWVRIVVPEIKARHHKRHIEHDNMNNMA